MPQPRNVLGRPHHVVWSGPLHSQRRCHSTPEHLLAQSPDMDNEWLLGHPYRDPCGRIMPLPGRSLLVCQRQRLAALRVVCSPPEINPATAQLHTAFPSHSSHRAHDSSRALTRGLSSVYLPLHSITTLPVPPLRNHLLIDAVAHKTIPFTHGLSRMPMVNSHHVSPAPSILPRSLMDNTYSALKKRVREALLAEWPGILPTPGYYHHLPALNPRPFMGVSKFIAGRIHQIRAGKSYLAAHPYSKVFRALVRTLPFGPPSHCSKGSPPSSASLPPDSPLRCFRQILRLPPPHCPSRL